MITLKRILVPHDFGETSTAAMNYATALAKKFGASLDVLHVSETARTDINTEFPEGLEGSVVDEVRARLLKFATPRETPELGVDLHVRAGTPHHEITRHARERDSDLIVMGTHGRGSVTHAVMGSVAETVVRTAPCPVLTVHRPQRDVVVSHILVATDFEAASDSALAYGRALAGCFGARLHLLHVMENYFLQPVVADPRGLEARARQQLDERLTDDDRLTLRATAALEVSDSPAAAIAEYAGAANIDLIVMGTHGRRLMDRLLMGSVAERVVRTAPCPVLTVHLPEREFVVPDGPVATGTPR